MPRPRLTRSSLALFSPKATILNCLLRSYIAHSQYDQADTLRSKTTDTFTDNKSNNQFARYQYYLGRIHAVQLNYSESHTCLLKVRTIATEAGLLLLEHSHFPPRSARPHTIFLSRPPSSLRLLFCVIHPPPPPPTPLPTTIDCIGCPHCTGCLNRTSLYNCLVAVMYNVWLL